MASIDPRHLRYVLTVARTGSLSKAAGELNLSQPAISAGIARLEAVLNACVLDRGHLGATPTRQGEILLRYAESIESLLKSAEEEVRLSQLGITGPLRIGATPLPTAYMVPRAVAGLIAERGRSDVEIIQGVDDELLEMLLEYRIDLMVGTIGFGETGDLIEEVPLFKAGIATIFRPAHPLASREQIRIADLSEYQLALPSLKGVFRTQIEALFITAGVEFPQGVIHAPTSTSLLELAAHSDVVVLLPPQVAQRHVEGGLLKAADLVEPSITRVFGVRAIRNRRLSPAGERLRQIMIEVAGLIDSS